MTYTEKAVTVGPDKLAIPGRRCFELVTCSSHQQGIYVHVHVQCTLALISRECTRTMYIYTYVHVHCTRPALRR